MMQLAVMIEGQEGLTWERWRHLAEMTERLGYTALFRSDHLRSLAGREDRATIEAWESLAYLATATRRIRFGTLVSPMTFRHPALLAMQAAAVDVLSGGRLDLGLGAGWNVLEHESFGIPFPSVGTRQDMLEEGIQVVRALWSGAPASFQGRIYALRDAPGSPRPLGARIVVGGRGERRLLRTAARYADEWNISNPTMEQYRAKIEALERHCREAGRDPRRLRRSLMLPFIVGEDDAALRCHAAAVRARHPDSAPEEAERRPEVARENGWLVGRPDEVVAQLRAWEALGVERVMLQHFAMDEDAPLELIAREVLPRVA